MRCLDRVLVRMSHEPSPCVWEWRGLKPKSWREHVPGSSLRARLCMVSWSSSHLVGQAELLAGMNTTLISRALVLKDLLPPFLSTDSSFFLCDCLREIYQALEKARSRTNEPTCRGCVVRETCKKKAVLIPDSRGTWVVQMWEGMECVLCRS